MALFIFIFLVCLFRTSHGVSFQRCEIFEGLLDRGFDASQINDWVCLIEAESNRETSTVTKNDEDGSSSYGLFQLNSRRWCQGPGTASNECDVDCTQFLADTLDPSAECALHVFATNGFKAWSGWREKCEEEDISIYTKDCLRD